MFGVFAGRIRLAGHCAVFRADMLGVNFGTSSFSHSMKSFKLFNDVKGCPFAYEFMYYQLEKQDMTLILSLPSP